MTIRCFIISCLLSVRLMASDSIPVRYLGIEQGLSNNVVTSIYQDHDGFMWFGTYDGLNRYDGYGFQVFRNIIGDTGSLSDNHIYNIAGDAAHNIWISSSKGISVYHPVSSAFTSPMFLGWKDNRLQHVQAAVPAVKEIDHGRMILAGTDSKGLLVFEQNSNTGYQVPLDNNVRYTVTTVEYDALRKQVWVFVPQAGLCLYDPVKRFLKTINTSIHAGNYLKVDSKGNLWLGNDNGLFAYDAATNSFSENRLPFKNRVTAIIEDKQHVLWIASDGGGLYFLTPGAKQALPYLSKAGTPVVNSNAIYAIYQDASDRKWIGTLRGGINLIQPGSNSFSHITYSSPGQNNIINNFILSFCEDEKNNLWIGTDGAGLRYWDRRRNQSVQYSNNPSVAGSISSNFITSISKDHENDTWISTYFGGINRLKNNSNSFEHFTCFNPTTKAEENNVWLVYEDRQKRLWASTVNNGTLYTFNRSTNRFDLFDPKIINIQTLAEDLQGNFWAGNYTQLILVDREKKQHRVYEIGYPVRCIHEDQRKNLWVGTEGGGLLLFDRGTGKFQRLTTADGLPNNTILRLLEDKKGKLWLSTYNGLSRFDPIHNNFRNFSQTDGLQSNQFSFNAGLALHSGEFIFGGIKGFNLFFPDSVYDKKEIPKTFLTGLKINNRAVEEDTSYVTERDMEKIGEITVPYDKAVVSIDFIALEYSGVDKIKYAYLLEGWDKTWNYVNNIRTANYSRLQEGNYKFKIKVTNADGVWSEEKVLLRIIVLPPWYRTWWAYILYAVFLGGLIYLYVLYNKRQERLRYEVKLAHLESEKEKELTEKKISFFTHISHEFRTPLTLIINPMKELISEHENEQFHKRMSMIHRNAKRLLSLVDQLLLFRKADAVDQQMRIERFDITEVCQEVFLSFSQHAHAKHIRFTYNKNEEEISLYADKEKIEIILFNLVSNAFKYTDPGGEIKLQIEETDKKINITVTDTGSGIPAATGNKLFDSFYQAGNTDKSSQTGFGIGLYVSQKLAMAHKGELYYTSEQGKGTMFTLTLPKGKHHFSALSVSEDYKAGQTILHELVEDAEMEFSEEEKPAAAPEKAKVIDKIIAGLPTMVIVDDNAELRSYIREIFTGDYTIYEADDGSTGFELILKESPDIVISDVMMKNVGGIELVKKIKETAAVAHTPVILLTASSSDEIKLKGIEGGAEDYMNKPFDRELIIAKVKNILKGRNRLQQYFFNTVTLQPTSGVAGEHKEFLERCMTIVEKHLDDPDFTIQIFCKEIGMSHPSLYKKIKAVSGLTVNVFIRYLRLRKAAELLINSNKTIVEVTYITGFNDVRYFREQFFKLFGMKPSDYIKKYRKVLGAGLN